MNSRINFTAKMPLPDETEIEVSVWYDLDYGDIQVENELGYEIELEHWQEDLLKGKAIELFQMGG